MHRSNHQHDATASLPAFVRSILDASFDAVVVMNLSGRIVEWNRRAEDVFGWPREEVIDSDMESLIMPEGYREKYRRGMERFRETGSGPVLSEKQVLTALNKSGEEFPIELSTSAVNDGQRSWVVGFVRDLTEHFATRQQLARHSLEAELLEQATSLFGSSDSFEEALQACLSILCEAIGWPIGHVFVVSDSEQRLESTCVWYLDDASRFETLRRNVESATFEKGEGIWGRCWESGDLTFFDATESKEPVGGGLDLDELKLRGAFGFPVRIDSEIVAVMAFFSPEETRPDGHQLRIVESISGQLGRLLERRRVQEERIRQAAIVDSSADAIIAVDAAGKIINWNRGAEVVYGYSANEAIGQHLSLLFPQELTVEDSVVLRSVLNGEELSQFETRRRRKNQQIIDVSITVAPIRLDDGRLVGASSIDRDITVQRQRARELEQARDAAEAANRAKSEFLANVSHELRTPMNSIIGMTDLALRNDLPKEVRDCLMISRDSADTLLFLMNDILDFSRMEAGRFELGLSDFSLRNMLNSTIKALALRAHKKGLELACHVDYDVPHWLRGDPERLRQIITNLVANALKFTDQGEVVVRVSREPADSDRLEIGDDVVLHISVADTGIGIAPEDQQRILAPFTQADASTTRRHSGTGLGLSICRKLAALMNGSLWLESEHGAGSTFHVQVRLQVAAEGDDEQQRERITVEPLRGTPVLVVDDNDTNQRILSELLANWSFRPTMCSSADEAFDRLVEASDRGEPFPLVIVDALMPDVDGFMLIERIHAEERLKRATILMLSSADLHVFKERCASLPVSAYLEKPVSQSDLLDAIIAALPGAQQSSLVTQTFDQADEPLRILVAEDTHANQEVITRILTKRGHHVEIANNGHEAIDCTQRKDFDVVIMDVQMPTMDGLQSTAAIRELEQQTSRRVPIVALTAHTMRHDREKCLAAGMDDYLAKPINAERLIRVVESLAQDDSQQTRRVERRVRKSAAAEAEFGPVTFAPPEVPTVSVQNDADSDSTVSSGRVWDPTATLKRLGDDGDLLKDMIDYFLEDAPKLLNKIDASIATNEVEEVVRAAHSLKGLCSNFEAVAAAQAARTVQDLAECGNVQAADTQAQVLGREIARLSKQLARWQREVDR